MAVELTSQMTQFVQNNIMVYLCDNVGLKQNILYLIKFLNLIYHELSWKETHVNLAIGIKKVWLVKNISVIASLR